MENENEDDMEEADKGRADASSSQSRRCEKKSSRLSRTVEHSEDEIADEEQDRSNRLRRLDAHHVSTREVDDQMPYDFDRPVRGVAPEQQQATDDCMVQLDGMRRTAPAMYHRLCLQVLRHYPRWQTDLGGKEGKEKLTTFILLFKTTY